MRTVITVSHTLSVGEGGDGSIGITDNDGNNLTIIVHC